MLRAGVVWLALIAADAMAGTHEAPQFFMPAGSPDEYMQAGAVFARELDPNVEISFWDSKSGLLSVSQVSRVGQSSLPPKSRDCAWLLVDLFRQTWPQPQTW